MPVINNGLLDGVRRIAGAFRDLTVGGGLPGAPLGFRLRGATLSGPPVTGTWRAGDAVPDRAGVWWMCTRSGTPGTWKAAGAGQHAYDVMIAPSNAPAAILDTADVVLTGTADQTAINTALAALPGAGRALIAPGTVSVTDKIILNQSNVELHGCGYGTYIQASAGFNASAAAVIQLGTASVLTGNMVCDMQVDGNFGVASGSAAGLLASASELKIERVEIKNACGDGYYFQAYDGSTSLYEISARDCFSWSAAARGFHTGSTVANSEFQRVFAISNYTQGGAAVGTGGIYVEGDNNKFLQCHPYFNNGPGLEVAAGAGNIRVIDGEYETNSGAGILLDDGFYSIAIIGPVFYANAGCAIEAEGGGDALDLAMVACGFRDVPATFASKVLYIGGVSGVSVTGCTFDLTGATDAQAALNLDGCDGGSIQGCNFTLASSSQYSVLLSDTTEVPVAGNFLDYQAKETGTADYNVFAHNRWRNVGTTPFTLVGANSRATDNLPAADQGAVADYEQFTALTTTYTLATGTALQKLFNATTNGALTVAASTSYFFECEFDLSSTPSGAISFGFGGTATLTSLKYTAVSEKGATNLTTPTTPAFVAGTAAAAQILVATTTAGTGVFTSRIRGIVRINATGTLIPEVAVGVSTTTAAVVGTNSFFRVWPVGSNTAVDVGNWS